MLGLDELDAAHEAADRWRAYHGEPRLTHWAAAEIQGAKFQGSVVEHEALNAPNPFHSCEGRLCKRLNADRSALGAASRRLKGVDIKDPLAVGVDPRGVDVRARFGIVRLAFADEAPTPEDAERRIDALLRATS